MEKLKSDTHNVIPFTGYLQPLSPPTPPEKQTATPLLTAAVLLFVGGLAIGAISVHQSADYTQIEQLKTQAKQLSQAQKTICRD